jgi:glutamate formiminotransferase
VQFASHVVRLATVAASLVNLQRQSAFHPRLGAIDHISCHALVPSTRSKTCATSLARAIAAGLSKALPSLPVLMYGDASADGVKLQQVRRECGMCAFQARF